jgi:ABC-type sugar transport system ATPase subunit
LSEGILPGECEAQYISIEDLSKTYGSGRGQVEALREVSLSINAGEFIVVVGPSGCGKSTLVRCLAGIDDVSRGKIFVREADVTNLPAENRNFEWLPQRVSATFFANRILDHSIRLGPRLRREPTKEIEVRVQRAAKLLGVAHLLNRRPSEISGGELQRVALARALLRKPVAFLFDEPLTNLDERLREEARAEFRRIHSETGETFIYVTHEQREALSLATRCVVIREGRIEQYATPEMVYGAPSTLFVAKFFSQNGLNLLPAHLHMQDHGLPTAVVDESETHSPSGNSPAVSIGVRPEDMVADRAGSLRQRSPNLLPIGEAEVTGHEFYGSYYRLTLRQRKRVPESIVATVVEIPDSKVVDLYIMRDRAFVFDHQDNRIDAQL